MLHSLKLNSYAILFSILLLWSCDSTQSNISDQKIASMKMNKKQAGNLLRLPLDCTQKEYPNKLSQTLLDASHIGQPKELHPAFYGCFDWHSSVHGHWSMVKLLKTFPDVEGSEEAHRILSEHLTEENIQKEIEYFNRETEGSYERTYGWAWLFQLQKELNEWDDDGAKEMANNLQPLTNLLSQRYKDYLPRLVYPIRVGEHSNSAFGMSFTYDYAKKYDKELANLIEQKGKEYFLIDEGCPIDWEPSGYDFLSPCFEEIDLMRKILPKEEFLTWVDGFLPQLYKNDFTIDIGIVADRTDGKLVHLDGLNFSRAWVMYGLANQYEEFAHLIPIANKHVEASYPNLVGDSYEGGHWLGSFAIFALSQND